MSMASALQVGVVAGVIAWPLAAGVGIVLWSRARSAARARKLAAVEAGLKGFYAGVERAPVPARLDLVVDALAEGEALKSKAVKPDRRGAKAH